MNRGAVLHRRSGFSRDSPVAVEFETQAASLVGIDGRGAQAGVETIEDWQFEPQVSLRLSRVCERCGGKDARLRTTRRDSCQPLGQGSVLDQVPHVAGRILVRLARAFAGVDVQRIASAGHRHVEQTPLFLAVQGFIVGLGNGIGIAQFSGEGDESFFVGTRETREGSHAK